MANAKSGKDILAKFFDDGAYTALFAGADSAVTAAFGSANGQPVYAVCQHGTACSAKDADKMVKTLRLAAQTGNPAVTFYNAGGAVLTEGLEAVMAAAKVSAAVAEISGVVPQIAVVNGVCGGSYALAAAAADVCVMSQEGELFLTAPFTSAAKGDKVAEAGSAEYAAKAGVAHIVTKDNDEAAKAAAMLVGLLPANNISAAGVYAFSAPAETLKTAKYCHVQAAKSIVDADSALELMEAFGQNVYTALATVNGSVVGVVSTKAESRLCKVCAEKAARFVRLCDAFGIPVITLVNTDGFAAGCTDDMQGGIREAARLAGTYADATTAKIAVVTGKAVGAAYVALVNADITVAVNGCVIAPVEPKTAVSVLYKEELDGGNNIVADTEKKAAEYAQQQCSAAAALAAGAADFAVDAENVRSCVAAALDMLSTKRAQRMPKKHGNMAL